MRLDDRNLTIFTGLFLTVAISTVAQYGDTLMATFRGDSGVQTVNDVYTVRAGREQTMLVLLNDVNVGGIDAADVRLVAGPVCGTLRQIGHSFAYSGGPECEGRQDFRYCVTAGENCVEAQVAVRVRPDPAASARQIATAERENPDAREGEVAEDRIAGAGPEMIPASAPDAAPSLISTANAAPRRTAPQLAAATMADSGSFRRPDAVAPAVEGLFAAAPSMGSTTAVTVASAATDTLVPRVPAVLPRPPVETLDAAELPAAPADLSARVAALDAPARLGARDADHSLSGSTCSPRLTASPAPGAMARLTLAAPCYPAARALIVHERLAFAVKTATDGTLSVDVPAFATQAGFTLRFDDGQSVSAATEIADLADYARVAIFWAGGFDLDLHALEYGARPGSGGHVWAGAPGSLKSSARYGGGFSVSLGDPSLADAAQAEVYTFPLSARMAEPGAIKLVVEAYPDPDFCGAQVTVNHQAVNGGSFRARPGLGFVMPDCRANAASVILKNGVRPIELAALPR